MQHLQKIPMSTSCEPAKFLYNISHKGEMLPVFESLRQRKAFCDIKLETDDGSIIFAHKVVLASASPYFSAMFKNCAEKNKDLVVIKQVDSTTLQLLVDLIYTGKIVITEKNVQILIPATKLMQLNNLNETCCAYLQKQLHPKNCLSIKAFADLHSCTKLSTSSELYIQQNFTKVVEADEFLSLSSEQLVKLISNDELTVPSEEKVFECVIRWVKHELDSRKCILLQLLEHVRLPLTSEHFIFQKVLKEPIINDCPKCQGYVFKALHFHFLERHKLGQVITNPKCIWYKPRHPSASLKVILVVGGSGNIASGSTEWYDSKINRWKFGPKMLTPITAAGVAVLKDNLVFALGGNSLESPLKSVDVLDLSSEPACWKSAVDMLVTRKQLGVGVLNNCLYAVGGHSGGNALNSAEVFNFSTQEWRMVTSMLTRRVDFGVGVLNELLYVVGGYDDSSQEMLNSVECYHPSHDTWTPVAKMCKHRIGVGVGVLDGVLYAIGGYDGSETLKSVEAYRPSTGVWTTMADMHLSRKYAGVVALEGLLYAIGGRDGSSILDSVEFYNPMKNTWTMLGASMNVARCNAGAVTIDRPPNF